MATYPTITGLWDRLSAVVGEGTIEVGPSAAEIGDDILTWNGVNQSSTSFAATQATVDNQPTLLAAAPNGAAIVAFDATDFLVDPGSQHSLAAADRTITVAYRFTVATGSTKESIWELNSGQVFCRKESSSNKLTAWDDASSSIDTGIDPDLDTTWHIVTLATTSGVGGSEVWTDGAKAAASGNSAQDQDLNRLALGDRIVTGSQTLGMEILGLCIYSVKLSDDDIRLVQQYYNDQGGLAIAALIDASSTPGISSIGTFPQDG